MQSSILHTTLKDIYTLPSEKHGAQRIIITITVIIAYFWTAFAAICTANIGITLLTPYNIFNDMWINFSAIALITTFFCVPFLFVVNNSRFTYISALICFSFGIVLWLQESCSYCTRIIQTVEQGNIPDFSQEELIRYISAVRTIHQQAYFGLALVILSGFLLMLTIIIRLHSQVIIPHQNKD